MEKKISKWYQSCGIYLASSKQYEQRIQGVRNFIKQKLGVPVCCELVKCFMGIEYDIEKLSEFVKTFNEIDISFSEENRTEIPLLAGICIYNYIMEQDDENMGVMVLLAYERDAHPYLMEIFELIMQTLENSRMKLREVSEIRSITIPSLKEMTEDEKVDWGEGVNYVTSALTNQIKSMRMLRSNVVSLNKQLRNKNEEANLLWWLVAGWSEIYGCSLEKLSDKKAAVVVPLEVMYNVEIVPGPIAVKKIIQKALSGQKLLNEYFVKDYIEEIGEEVLINWKEKEYDVSQCIGFTPILELLQYRSRFSKKEDIQIVYKLFEEKYEASYLSEKVRVIDFAYQLYLEYELLRLLNGG